MFMLPAHDELSTCSASLVSPEHSVLSIPVRSIRQLGTAKEMKPVK